MKKICGLPTCDEEAVVLVHTSVCRPTGSRQERVAKLPRCGEHLCPKDDYETIPGKRAPRLTGKSFIAIEKERMKEAVG